jgi:hypothetical protein
LKRARQRVLALVLAAVAMLAVEAQTTDRLLLGVMRRDGVIVPFAFFDGGWSIPWPSAIRNLELPVTLDSVPKKWWGGELPASWTFWPIGSGEPTRVTPVAPVVIMAGRERRLGLRTTVTSSEPLPSPFELPFPKEGLAVAGDAKVEAIAIVSSKAAPWRDLSAALQADFADAEERAIRRVQSGAGWTHPVSREKRRTVVTELESWYTSTLAQPGFGVSYVEAVKKYAPEPEDDGCGLETFISGWVFTNTRQPRPKTDLSAKITYCNREGVSYMLPLGLLRLKNRTHWVFQISSWEAEWYEVVEATPGRVRYVAEYNGGGRPKPF